MVNVFIMIALSVVSIFMILLILVQRGKGGGLAGAFGGMGGQSAFGTKAGDMFTKITMWSAFFWIVLCAFSVRYMRTGAVSKIKDGAGANVPAAPLNPGVQQNSTVPGDAPNPASQSSPDPKPAGPNSLGPNSSDTTDSGNTTPDGTPGN